MIDVASRSAPLHRLDLPLIDQALAGVCEDAIQNPTLWRKLRREEMSADVIRRLLEGYRYVDQLLGNGTDLFAYGGSEQLLELNHLVLCGSSAATREAARKHMDETARHFYAARYGGVGSFIDWYHEQRGLAPQRLAAGVFMQIVSGPQLFIEGNQRTASLIASYVLATSGEEPFVLTKQTYRDAFKTFAQVKVINRQSWAQIFRFWRLRRTLCDTMKSTEADHFLLRN